MGQTVNIGKNTLGDNGKMSTYLHGYNRSSHNVGYKWRNTQAPGTLVPFICELMEPEDSWEIKLKSKVLTHPTVGPLFGTFKLQCDVFYVPMRLYMSALHNNKLDIGMNMKTSILPKLVVTTRRDMDAPAPARENSQVSSSCLLRYLGVGGYGTSLESLSTTPVNFKTEATPLLGYWDIFKNYYANRQEETAYYIGAAGVPSTVRYQTTMGAFVTRDANNCAPGREFLSNNQAVEIIGDNIVAGNISAEIEYTNEVGRRIKETIDLDDPAWGSVAQLSTTEVNWDVVFPAGITIVRLRKIITEVGLALTPFELKNIDEIREDILTTRPGIEFQINSTTVEPFGDFASRIEAPTQAFQKLKTSLPQFGLAVKTYNSDLFNNWVKTEWLDGEDGVNQISAVDVSGGVLTMDSLNLAKKVYDMLNRIAVSGGSYKDWVETVWDSNYTQRCETPRYEGGMSQIIGFQEVISNSQGESEDNPLGQLAGRGVEIGNQKGGTIKVKADEPGYLIGICSITPELDYSQGRRWFCDLDTLDDLHKPALDGIGFQDATLPEFAWWTRAGFASNLEPDLSVGKQPAWIKYMTNYNRTYGNFASGESEAFMVLNRNYAMGDNSSTGSNNTITDLTTYIDPGKFNYIFADVDLSAMNFWVQIGIEITARRKMSAKIIPNL